MTSCALSEGNRNTPLALHFRELDARNEAETRAHLESCADCRAYLAVLEQLGQALHSWSEETPSAEVRERVLAGLGQAAQEAETQRRSQTALPLFALVPAMAASIALTGLVAARLAAWARWEQLAAWPGVSLLGAFGVATLLMWIAGGLGSLALAPALVLENRKHVRAAVASR